MSDGWENVGPGVLRCGSMEIRYETHTGNNLFVVYDISSDSGDGAKRIGHEVRLSNAKELAGIYEYEQRTLGLKPDVVDQ